MRRCSELLDELRFELRGHQIVAYLPDARPSPPGSARAPSGPAHWFITIDGGPPFIGPVYLGVIRSQAFEAEAELRAFFETDPRLT